MKKKLFVLLAVLCLVALIVPMTVGAEEIEAAITVENVGETGYYEFTPTVSGYYRITSHYDLEDVVGYVLDTDYNMVAFDDDGGDVCNFQLGLVLKAENTYRICAYFNAEVADTIPITIEMVEGDTDLYADTTTNVVIVEEGEEVKYAFTPAYTETYTFYSISDYDTFGRLYDGEENLLYADDDGGENVNFSISYSLEAGVTYYFGVSYLSDANTGMIPVYLQTNHSYSELIVTAPTCTEEGLALLTCDSCGYSCEKVLPAAHNWNEDNVCADCEVDWYVEGACGDSATWKLDLSGTLTITGEGAMYNFEWWGAPWNSYADMITSIVVGDGIRTIGDHAFECCGNLTSVTLPNTVWYIGYHSFYGCYNLPAVDLPDYLEMIGAYAFADCSNLGSIQFPNTLYMIREWAFAYCTSLQTVYIPKNVSSFGQAAFIGCVSLDGIWVDEDNPYYYSDSQGVVYEQETLYLHSAPVTLSGHYTIPAGTVGVYDYAFYRCSGLTSVTIPDSMQAIGYAAFAWSGLTSVEFPDNITYMGGSMFEECDSLTSVKLPDGLERIGWGMFMNCDNLTNVEIPDTVTEICGYAFSVCWNLESIDLPSNLQYIWNDAFKDCSSLNNVVIPASVVYIDDFAFRWCESLTKVTFLGDAPGIVTNVPFGDVTATVYYPAGNTTWTEDVMQDYGGTLTWKEYTTGAITSQPSTQKVKAGNTATFKVTASGTDLTYQWQTKTSSSGSWKNCTFTGSKTASMSVPATTARNGYYYRCKITDVAGNVVYTNTVRLYALGVKTQPTTQKVKAGATATFTVSATGSGKTYQWQTKTSSSGSWKNCTFTGSKTATMSVPATTGRNGYYYRCKITDSAGNVVYTNSVRLYVLGIKTQPATQKVKAGSTAKFTVSATGYGLSYQWQTKTSSSGSWKNCTFTGSKTATMSVSATTARNGYYYRCKITDSAGNVTYTSTVRLYVLGIKTQPTSKTVKSGSTAKFTVSATGSGLSYQWQYKTSSGWKNTTLTGAKTATLSVKGTSARNGMKYRCKITDSAGNVIYTNTVKLTVK